MASDFKQVGRVARCKAGYGANILSVQDPVSQRKVFGTYSEESRESLESLSRREMLSNLFFS